MKGRKKTSDASKRLRGTDQPCRMDGELVPMAPASTLPKPKGLKGTAKKLYQLVGTELASKGLIDAVNIDLLLAYCREMALYGDMMKDLETEGYTITVATKTGSIKQVNPKRKIAENALVAAKTLASAYTCSLPMARPARRCTPLQPSRIRRRSVSPMPLKSSRPPTSRTIWTPTGTASSTR